VGKGALTNNLILNANYSTSFSYSIISFVAAVLVVASLYDLQVKWNCQ